MQIGIVGEHTALHPGFSGAMALNQIAAFTDAGHTVTLYVPDVEAVDGPDLSGGKARVGPDQLPRYGLDFDIKYLSEPEDFDSHLDVLIWQTYRLNHEVLWPKADRSFLLTKNYPRFAAAPNERYREKLKFQLAKVDRLAMALQSDVDILRNLLPSQADRFAHVPRGFSPEWLPCSSKGNIFTIACDAPVKPSDGGVQATAHMRLLVDELRRRGHAVRVVATRAAAALIGADEKVRPLPLFEFYKRFIIPAHIYLPCDLRYSVHGRNEEADESGHPVYIGLYENQVVEMQMAGAVPLIRQDQVDEELIFSEDACLVDCYENIEQMVNRCERVIAARGEFAARANQFAVQNNSHSAMVRAWENLLT